MTEKNYHHGDLKAQLIKEGLLILDKEGYQGLSLRKVAKACDVSQTAPYRHFKDKNELVAAIRSEAFRALNAQLEQAVTKHPNRPNLQLSEMGIAYIQFFVENPEYLRLLFFSSYPDISDVDNPSQEKQLTSQAPFQTFRDTILRLERSKAASPTEIEESILVHWGIVHGIALLIANKEIQLSGDYLEMVRNIFMKQC